MLTYILKRVLLFVPTLIIIVLISFLLLKSSGDDSVQSALINNGLIFDDNISVDYLSAYTKEAILQNNDKPFFYGSIVPDYYPKNINALIFPSRIRQAKALLKNTKNWEQIQKLFTEIDDIYADPSISKEVIFQMDKIQQATSLTALQHAAKALSLEQNNKTLELQKTINRLTPSSRFFFPAFHFHGKDNQFHHAITSIIRGDFGTSNTDGRPTMQIINNALPWTFVMVIIALILSIIIGIGLGIIMVLTNETWLERALTSLLYMVYAIPVFWLATLLVMFFTTDEYGTWTNIFPSIGINPISIGRSNTSMVMANMNRLWLPIFCIIVHELAYISRQLRSSLLDEMGKPYFITALAKGLTKREAIFGHALPNALIPIVTIIVGSIPTAFAGTVVLEVIFNIPGMGRVLLDAIYNYDWSVISAILIIISFVTLISYLLGDIIYAYLNPKIKLSKKW